MTTSITRNLVLVAALALSTSALLSPALASPKGAGGGALAGIVKHYQDYCGTLESIYNKELSAAGNSKGAAAEAHAQTALQTSNMAEQNGCGWASQLN